MVVKKRERKVQEINSKKESLIPNYWGNSQLLQDSSPSAISKYFHDIGETNFRSTTIGLLLEPYLMGFCRRAQVIFPKKNLLVAIREFIETEVTKLVEKLVNSATKKITFDVAKDICSSLNHVVLSDHVKLVEHVTFRRQFKKSSYFWDVFETAIRRIAFGDLNRVSLLIKLRALFFKQRLEILPNKNTNGSSEDRVIQRVVTDLDDNLFRMIMAYLLSDHRAIIEKEKEKEKEPGIVLFDAREISWNIDRNLSALAEDGNSAADWNTKKNGPMETFVDDYSGLMAIHIYAASGNLEQVQSILDRFPEQLNQPTGRQPIGDGNGELNFCGFTPLHFAAANGHVEIVKELLKRGANHRLSSSFDSSLIVPIGSNTSDYWNTFSSTPLHLAIRGNHLEVIEILLNPPPALPTPAAPASREKGKKKGKKSKNSSNIDDEDASSLNDKDPFSVGELLFTVDDDECGEFNETLPLSPLLTSIIFDRKEAMIQCLRHGASLKQIGKFNDTARVVFLFRWMKDSNGCNNYVSGSPSIIYDAVKEVVQELMNENYPFAKSFFNEYFDDEIKYKELIRKKVLADNDDDDDEEEDADYAWLEDDWDSSKILEGDSIDTDLLSSQLSEEYNQFLPILIQLANEYDSSLTFSNQALTLLCHICLILSKFILPVIRSSDKNHEFSIDGLKEFIHKFLPQEAISSLLKKLESISSDDENDLISSRTYELGKKMLESYFIQFSIECLLPSNDIIQAIGIFFEDELFFLLENSGNHTRDDDHLIIPNAIHIEKGFGELPEFSSIFSFFITQWSHPLNNLDSILIKSDIKKIMEMSSSSSAFHKVDEYESEKDHDLLMNFQSFTKQAWNEVKYFEKTSNQPIIGFNDWKLLLQKQLAAAAGAAGAASFEIDEESYSIFLSMIEIRLVQRLSKQNQMIMNRFREKLQNRNSNEDVDFDENENQDNDDEIILSCLDFDSVDF